MDVGDLRGPRLASGSSGPGRTPVAEIDLQHGLCDVIAGNGAVDPASFRRKPVGRPRADPRAPGPMSISA